MKEAATKVIDTLTQENFHEAFQKLLERYKCIVAGGDILVYIHTYVWIKTYIHVYTRGVMVISIENGQKNRVQILD